MPQEGFSQRYEPRCIASLRQVLEQVGHELAAGISHDPGEVAAIIGLAREKVEVAAVKKAPKARFRGIGR